jgi:hypothetical protein
VRLAYLIVIEMKLLPLLTLGVSCAIIRVKQQPTDTWADKEQQLSEDGTYNDDYFLVDSFDEVIVEDEEDDIYESLPLDVSESLKFESPSKDGATEDGEPQDSSFYSLFSGQSSSWKYLPPGENSLQQVVGFSYCRHLNLAVFDVDAPMDSLVVNAVLEATDSLTNDNDEKKYILLKELVKNREMARMFSPTVDPDTVIPRPKYDNDTASSGGEPPTITIRKLGHISFAKLIDSVAELLVHAVVSKYKLAPLEKNSLFDAYLRSPIDSGSEAKRFSCFMVSCRLVS